MKILHVIDHIYPILGYQETFLAKSHSVNHETLVISSNRHAKSIYDANRKLLKNEITNSGISVEEGLKILRLPIKFDIELFDSPWLKDLEKEVKDFKPDLIIAHGLANITSIRLAMQKSKLKKTALVFDDHMTYNASSWGWASLFYRIFRILFTPLFLKSASAFVAVTPETKTFMHKMYGIPNERIKIIPLGFSRDNFRKDLETRNIMRKKYGIPVTSTVLIYAGKIVSQKGVHLFIDAAIQLAKNNRNLFFIIVGGSDPSYLATLKNKVANANMNDLFVFLDAVPNQELFKYYNAADIGVWPLQCSVTMLEATACGLPSIISDKCGATERVAAGNGLLYSQSNSTDLANKIISLLNPELRAIMSEIAVAYSRNLCWDKLSTSFLEISRKTSNK
jgi:glycosyltransferase involved in cell wall biosynthesis